MYSTLLAKEILQKDNMLTEQYFQIEELRLTAACYKARFYGKSKLAEVLHNQRYKRILTGECITLENMLFQKIINEDDYNFCNSL